jgi:hypothetical protein
MSKGCYDKLYEFLREMFNKEKLYQLQMLENGEIESNEFGTDEEIFDHMIDWFVEDVRNLKLEDIKDES